MDELDKIMKEMGFNKVTVNRYTDELPFKSRQAEIMRSMCGNATAGAQHLKTWVPLVFILIIASSILSLRLFWLWQTGDAMLLVRIVVDYFEQFKKLTLTASLLASVTICASISVMCFHLRNEEKFMLSQ